MGGSGRNLPASHMSRWRSTGLFLMDREEALSLRGEVVIMERGHLCVDFRTDPSANRAVRHHKTTWTTVENMSSKRNQSSPNRGESGGEASWPQPRNLARILSVWWWLLRFGCRQADGLILLQFSPSFSPISSRLCGLSAAAYCHSGRPRAMPRVLAFSLAYVILIVPLLLPSTFWYPRRAASFRVAQQALVTGEPWHQHQRLMVLRCDAPPSLTR